MVLECGRKPACLRREVQTAHRQQDQHWCPWSCEVVPLTAAPYAIVHWDFLRSIFSIMSLPTCTQIYKNS